MRTSLVSIITPTYNRAYCLGKAVLSILGQTYSNWELLIVDDGSIDETKKLVLSFYDPRIKYFAQNHKGQSAARNYGLSKARGEWISYLDSDNEFYPNYLEVALGELQKNRHALYALIRSKRTLELYKGGKLIKLIDDSNDFPPSLNIADIFCRKLHTDINGFIHSSKIIEAGIWFDEQLPMNEDWDFIMQIGEKFPDSFLYITRILLNYHQRFGGDGVVSNSTYRDWAKLFEYIYQKHKDSALMAGQAWYPERVQLWNKRADDFDKGLLPPYYLHYFQDN